MTMSIYHEYREVMYQHHRFGMNIDPKHLKISPLSYRDSHRDSVNFQCPCNFLRRNKIGTFENYLQIIKSAIYLDAVQKWTKKCNTKTRRRLNN